MDRTNHHSLIILGCGASGMTAAISASVYEKDLLILERNDTPGKKLPATGNGKCNYTNLNICEEDFRSSSGQPFSYYKRFNNQDTINFFRHLGVPLHQKNGYCYPYSGQAASIRDALYNKLTDLHIPVVFGARVTSITYTDRVYSLKCKDIIYTCDKLIISAGGQAQSCFGTDGSLYYMCKKLGHSVVEPLPALVGLVSSHSNLKELSGVRHEANVILKVNSKVIYTEFGEIIFSKTGISGIPVMNLSRFAAEALSQSKSTKIQLDFFPDYSVEDVSEFLYKHYINSGLNLSQSLVGVLNDKLISVILGICNLQPDYCVKSEESKQYFIEISRLMKKFTLVITGTCGFENAQSTAGGIPLNEIDKESLESNFCDGLYMTGELLDVDGKCGGYNLQWAWTTGAIAGAYAGGGCFDKNKFLKA